MFTEYDLPSFDRKNLLGENAQGLLNNQSFINTTQPILWLVANGYAQNTDNYYHKVADSLDLEFLGEIPVKINDSNSLANKVGTEIQSKYCFFTYMQNETLVIATADPTPIEEMLENVLPFLTKKPAAVQVKISPHTVIRQALAQSSYLVSNKLAESRLKETKSHLSSYAIFNQNTSRIFLIILILFFIFFAIFPYPMFLGIYIFINIFYFLLNPVKFFITLAGIAKKLPDITSDNLKSLPDENLPIYTVLIPLKNEQSVASSLITHLKKLDYPKDKLDIKVITEVDDEETLQEIRKQLNLSSDHTSDSLVFDLIKVPQGTISTKPRSLNFALQFARGTVSVIYDAEDRPEVDQLKKAYFTFLDKKLDTLCIQGKLNYYNSRQNILTRFFTLEYSFWFDVLLPGLQAWKIPMPLGGTSNHFLTETLRKIGMWDPYNVTEDADIGWRLSRLGYSTSMVNSYTWEEANSKLWNWVKQRTRWQKGFLMTLLVHLRTPFRMWKELGPWGFFSSILLFTTNFFLPVINPFLWVLFLGWYIPLIFGLTYINLPIPRWLQIAGLVNLIFGNGVYMFTHAVGILKIKRYDLLIFVPFLPLYWFLLSFASYRAIFQIFRKPYHWEKTTHGLTT